MLRGEVRDDVCECAVERALSVEGALELQEGAVPLVRRLLGQRERLLAPNRVVPAMRKNIFKGCPAEGECTGWPICSEKRVA